MDHIYTFESSSKILPEKTLLLFLVQEDKTFGFTAIEMGAAGNH